MTEKTHTTEKTHRTHRPERSGGTERGERAGETGETTGAGEAGETAKARKAKPATGKAVKGKAVRARLGARLRRLPVWWLVPSCALAGAVVGGAYGMLKTPQYTATSYVIAVPTDRADPATALGFAQAYGRVATQLAVLGDAQVAAGIPVRTLRESVRATTSPDAPMVAVSATSSRPGKAADIADAVSRSLTLDANRTEDSTHVQLIQFSRATEPAEPSSASARTTALMGACAGGLLGGLALLVRPRRQQEGAPAAVPGPAPAADLHRSLG